MRTAAQYDAWERLVETIKAAADDHVHRQDWQKLPYAAVIGDIRSAIIAPCK